ncbi:hypothetical protein L1987_00745 [Smallanthus sonchifolius]|uniref:Uncharacterized protein n=1 Tax=Smallanthus sonchifolius TaxID=185202 RepID=A0ACB9K338_9ASTR|nr:hypothetical protein L1987_00745 [Smallanthus sonchifolius]
MVWDTNTFIPASTFLALAGMKKKQRDTVRSMGFGKLLSFKVDGIPSKLGHYVVDMFDTKKMEINLGAVQIKVNKESVHQLLGIPNSGINLFLMARQKKQDSVCEEWKRRNRGKVVSPTEITERIIESNDAME